MARPKGTGGIRDRDAARRRWQDPTYRKLVSAGVSAANQRRWRAMGKDERQQTVCRMLRSAHALRLGSSAKHTRLSSIRPCTKDVTWAAGFLEGEGCFGKGVSAVQVNREPLQRLFDWFGGYLRRHANGPNKLIWEWSCGGARARGIQLTIYQFMSAKRQQQIRRGLALVYGRGHFDA